MTKPDEHEYEIRICESLDQDEYTALLSEALCFVDALISQKFVPQDGWAMQRAKALSSALRAAIENTRGRR
jgi:hypothetical protein